MATERKLWHDRSFRRLWFGQAASQLGAQASQVTLPLVAVIALGVGADQLGVLRAVQQIPVLLLALLVGRKNLARGNSVLEGTRSAAQIGGPALGGGLVSLLTAPLAIFTSTIFFALSFLAIRRIHRSDIALPTTESPLRQIRSGPRLVFGDGWLRAACLASGFYQFSFAALMTGYLLFLPRTLHLSGAEVGLVLAAFGPGALIGSLLSAKLPERLGYGVVLMSAVVIADAAMLGVPALTGSGPVTVGALIAINIVYGAFTQLVNVGVMAVRQAVTPLAMQGRVAATLDFLGMGLSPLGSLAGGLLASQYGARTTALVAAIGLWLSPLCLALSPLARLGKSLPTTSARMTEEGQRMTAT